MVMFSLSGIAAAPGKLLTASFSDFGLPDWLTFAGVVTAALTGIALIWNEVDKRFLVARTLETKKVGGAK
jgi:hypothetical protein